MTDPAPAPEQRKEFHLLAAIRLVWHASRGWTLANLFLVVLQGLLPLVALYLLKKIVDAVTASIGSPDPSGAFSTVLLWVLLAGGTALLIALCRSLGEWITKAQSVAVSDHVADVLHAQSIALDLEYYEDSRYHDTLHRAQQEAAYRPTSITNGLIQLGQSSISLLGVAGIWFAFNWWLGLALLLVAIPGALIRLVYARRLDRFEQVQAESERRAWYYHWLMIDSGHAKEIRLFGLGPLFRQRFRNLRQGLRQGRLDLVRRRALADFVGQGLASVAVFGSLAFVAYQTILGRISLGDLVLYYSSFQLGLGALQTLLRGLAGLYEDNLFLQNFYRFLGLQPKIEVPTHPQPLPPFAQSLVFQNVHFRYPTGTQDALTGLNLRLEPGQVIALVGENGAGKTTLAKLLCRLYDPAEGQITLNGTDLRQLDPVEWRSQISVVFQDYLHYALSAWENIWLGQVEREPDRSEIEKIARQAGANEAIERLPQGYDTQLGFGFRHGTELSIGEWQKIALARAFFRDARIVVLDEPTSALDPLAEAELFAGFRRLLAGRSAILISHRFSTVQMADRIYVLQGGRVVEEGTHTDLLAQNGRYATLYRAQAKHYQ